MPRAALEVPGAGADQDLIFPDHTLTASPAHTAVRIHNNSAALHEYLEQPFLHSLQVYLLGGRHHQETYMISHLSSFQDTGAYTQLADPAIVAGT